MHRTSVAAVLGAAAVTAYLVVLVGLIVMGCAVLTLLVPSLSNRLFEDRNRVRFAGYRGWVPRTSARRARRASASSNCSMPNQRWPSLSHPARHRTVPGSWGSGPVDEPPCRSARERESANRLIRG